MSSVPAGWYGDPQNAAQLRYWDGSSWTEHTAPGQQQVAVPGAAVAPGGYYAYGFPNVYDNGVDLGQALTAEQREQYKHHTLTSFPTWLVVVLHFLTLSLFTLIYQGLKFSKLPPVKQDDFGAGKGIGFMFIPFFNIYWAFRYTLGLTDRLNFQFRLRGQPPPISRGLALTAVIVYLIPYAGLLSWVFLMPIVAGQWQSATNKLAAENEGRQWAAQPGLQAPAQALPPPSAPPS